MRLLPIILFCVFSLTASLALAYGLYPHAKLSDTQLDANKEPQPMESFEQIIDLGDDFGEMSVIDLLGYYLDNPPVQADNQETSQPLRQFGGC